MHLLDSFPDSIYLLTIRQVGGSTGQGSIALAKMYPDLNFIVQDLPEVVADGDQITAALNDSSVSRRIKFQPHNFFEPQPVIGANIYLLRMILHDWAFDDAVEILTCLIPALKRGSRIVIMDTVLPVPGSIPAARERLLRVRDMTMMQVFNSQERSIEDWEAISGTADSRLKIRSVNQPFGSVMSLIELQLMDE